MALINSSRRPMNSYGAALFDETKLTTLFTQIGQLEGQEIAEGEAKYSTAIATAYAQRMAVQQSRATALYNQIQTETVRVIAALQPNPSNVPAANATLAGFIPIFGSWLKAFYFTDATVAAGSQALTVISNFSQFVAGADRYPQTATASRNIYAALAGLFKAATQTEVYNSLYPKG